MDGIEGEEAILLQDCLCEYRTKLMRIHQLLYYYYSASVVCI